MVLYYSSMKNTVTLFPTRVSTKHQISWREALESFTVSGFWYNNLIRALTGSLSVEWCIAVRMFWKSSRLLARRSGPLFLALYLKQARVCLQRYVAGDSIPPTLSPRVALTRCGLPVIIPSFHRRKIREGHVIVIQLYMSLFSFSKVIPLAKKVTHQLFESITSPCLVDLEKSTLIHDISEALPRLYHLYVPRIKEICLKQQISFIPTWKTVPSWPQFRNKIYRRAMGGCELAKAALPKLSRSSFFPVFYIELLSSDIVYALSENPCYAYLNLMMNTQSEVDYVPLDIEDGQLKAQTLVQELTKEAPDLQWYHRIVQCRGKYLFPLSRLSMMCTGDGKRRLFTIGNYMRQRYLSPLHDWCENVLRTLVTDGTFDQLAPLNRLEGSAPCFSVDLKAATDRWPVSLMESLVASTFGPLFADVIVGHMLAKNDFQIPFLDGHPSIRFEVGQPLGLHSSWPLFALSHHVLIWYAAHSVYPNKRFLKYAVLGDDVVIADSKVHTRYRELIHDLGVQVSEGKCISSESGAMEFGKRFRLCRGIVDVSPVSLKRISHSREPIGWINYIDFMNSLPGRRPMSRYQALRIGGLSHRSAVRPLGAFRSAPYTRFLEALWIQSCLRRLNIFSIRLMTEAVLRRPVHHQAYAFAFREMLIHFYPKALKPVPDEVIAVMEKGADEFVEPLLYTQWMKSYLTYLRWYSDFFLTPGKTLDSFLDAPVYIHTWNAPRKDITDFRYGALFRIIDTVAKFRSHQIVGELSEGVSHPRDTP